MARIQSGIRGINRTTLWNSWKEIRRELRSASVRDPIDFLDYDIDPNIWINRLIHHLDSRYTIRYTHDCFPAHEVWIKDQQLIYGYMPSSASFSTVSYCLFGVAQIVGQSTSQIN